MSLTSTAAELCFEHSTNRDADWEMRTRAIAVSAKRRVAWDERLVVEAPSQKGP